MRQKILVVGLLLAFVVSLALAAETVPDFVYTEPALVCEIIDGDTFDVRWPTHDKYVLRIRPASIDTPEKGDCFYEEAKEYAEAILLDHWVWLDRGDPNQLWSTDQSGRKRLLAKVWLDFTRTTSFGRIMVSQGYAEVLTEYPRGKELDALGIEEEAKHAKRGRWGECPLDE